MWGHLHLLICAKAIVATHFYEALSFSLGPLLFLAMDLPSPPIAFLSTFVAVFCSVPFELQSFLSAYTHACR